MNKRERQNFRIHEPYCLKQVGPGRYIKLNRDYKPLGLETEEWVRYEDFPLVSLPGLTPQKAAKLSPRGSASTDAVYLYDDGCIPTQSAAHMRAYLARIALLAKLEVASRPIRHPAHEIRNT